MAGTPASSRESGGGSSAIPYESRSSNTILGTADQSKSIDLTATFTQTFDAAATLGAGWWVILRCVRGNSYAVVTLDPSGGELINGLATQRIVSGTEALVLCTGTAFVTQTLAGMVSPADLDCLVAWWDATDASTITDAGAGAVSAWVDKSGNGYTLTEAANRPVTGTRTINGLNVLDFDGTNDQLRITAGLYMAPSAIYVVGEPDAVNGTRVLTRGNGGAALYTIDGALLGEIPAASSLAAGCVNGTPNIYSARALGSGCYARAGGVGRSVVAGPGTIDGKTEWNVGCQSGGGSFFWDGKIGEVVLCNGLVGDLTDLALRHCLANKWALTA